MPIPFQITRATVADAGELATLLDAYRRFYRQASDQGAARAFLLERLDREESVVFIARPGPSPRSPATPPQSALGFVQLYPTFSSVSLGTRWILNDLFVDEPARRGGVARALTLRAMDHARHSGAHGIMLLTEVSNAPAQALYESLGWSRDTAYHRYTWKP